jgi:8-oxo-dGTP pyrophosphatase MutT (NUDIX family)
MLDLDLKRQGPVPRDASTLVVARDAPGGVEVFFVERQKAGFLGGAVVFPGGKLDEGDLDPEWELATTAPRSTPVPIAADATALRGLAIAACREALEEAAILPIAGDALTHEDLLALRSGLASGTATFRALLSARGLRLDLASLHPLARWITPVAESRRFDTRFYLFVSDGATTGAHDEHETTASFWARPSDVLERYEANLLLLAPPTHRTLQVLAPARTTADAIAIAAASCLDPICPRVVPHRDPGAAGDTMALVLPGDPEHDVSAVRVPGASRYVLRDGRFRPEPA